MLKLESALSLSLLAAGAVGVEECGISFYARTLSLSAAGAVGVCCRNLAPNLPSLALFYFIHL